MLPQLNLTSKINEPSIYLPSDTNYFNLWTKLFVLSAKKHAAWLNLHCHIFDITEADKLWCVKHGISFSSELTPTGLSDDAKKGYWVNMRFFRIPEIFDDSAPVLALDVDGLIVNDITRDEFIRDLSQDWVAVREKGSGSLGGCVGLAANNNARHVIRNKFYEIFQSNGLNWYVDQELFNNLINEGILKTFGMKYVDYHFRPISKIWTGKGNRKFKKRGKANFPELIENYKLLLRKTDE